MEKQYQVQDQDEDEDVQLLKLDLIGVTKDRIEQEIKDLCLDVIQYLPDLLALATTAESRTFYLKMHADYQRYVADASLTDGYKPKIEEAKGLYEQALREAEQLFPTHPLKMAVALNFSVFLFDNLKDTKQAIELAKNAFDQALFDFESVDEEIMTETLRVMQLLKDNFTLWQVDQKHEEANQGEKGMEDDSITMKLILKNKIKEKHDRKKISNYRKDG